MSIEHRMADFKRRASFAPKDVYRHPTRSIRYIPAHAFAAEGVSAPGVDAWCDFSSEVALVESMTANFAQREVGIWLRRDDRAPHFLKVFAVLDCPGITRDVFESLLATIADHSNSRDGFAAIAPGLPLEPLRAR